MNKQDGNNIEKTKEVDNTTVIAILLIIFAIFLFITSLPAIILAVILTIMVIKIKQINKLIFPVVGIIAAIVLNSKMPFIETFLSPAVSYLKSISIYREKINYVEYLKNINYLWQISLGLIFSGCMTYLIALNMDIDDKKNYNELKKENVVNKKLKKIQNQKHKGNTTTLGIDYEEIKSVSIDDNAKHICIAGTTGAGKTVAISNFIESALQKGNPVFAIDGKGDLDNGSLLHYMQELSKRDNRKLYVINVTNPSCSDFYNPFKDAGITEAKDMLIGMNNWSEEHYKINTERYLQQLIKIMKIANIQLDLNTIIKYSPSEFVKLLEKLKNDQKITIEEFLKINEIINSTKDIVNSAMARFATTAESEAGEIFNYKGIDIYTAMKEKSNILIILDSLGKPELSKQVGRLAILDAKKAVSKLFGDDTRKFFIFDEFNVYASDVAIDLLNKSRSANVTCIPAFQSLSDLDKAGGIALRNQIIENCNNYLIMRQNSPDSSNEWERVAGEYETLNYTYGIEEKNNLFFGKKNEKIGTGSMYEVFKSKYKSTEIQNLFTGQAIYISKDQLIDKKIKIKIVKLETESPELIKRKIVDFEKECISFESENISFKNENINFENKNISFEKKEIKNDIIIDEDFSDIEELLNN